MTLFKQNKIKNMTLLRQTKKALNKFETRFYSSTRINNSKWGSFGAATRRSARAAFVARHQRQVNAQAQQQKNSAKSQAQQQENSAKSQAQQQENSAKSQAQQQENSAKSQAQQQEK